MKFLTAAAIALSLLAPLSQAATTLKIATLAPDGTNWMKEMRKAAATIKKETEGRVSVKYFPGGVQGSDSTVLRKMRINQLQGGMMSIGALADVSNVTQLYSLPFTFRNLDEVSAVRRVGIWCRSGIVRVCHGCNSNSVCPSTKDERLDACERCRGETP